MALAAERADLIVIAGPDDGLAELAPAGRAVPCVTVPVGPVQANRTAMARAVAALFVAGAITGLDPSDPPDSPGTGPGSTLAGQFVPRMREGEATGARTTVRSV